MPFPFVTAVHGYGSFGLRLDCCGYVYVTTHVTHFATRTFTFPTVTALLVAVVTHTRFPAHGYARSHVYTPVYVCGYIRLPVYRIYHVYGLRLVAGLRLRLPRSYVWLRSFAVGSALPGYVTVVAFTLVGCILRLRLQLILDYRSSYSSYTFAVTHTRLPVAFTFAMQLRLVHAGVTLLPVTAVYTAHAFARLDYGYIYTRVGYVATLRFCSLRLPFCYGWLRYAVTVYGWLFWLPHVATVYAFTHGCGLPRAAFTTFAGFTFVTCVLPRSLYGLRLSWFTFTVTVYIPFAFTLVAFTLRTFTLVGCLVYAVGYTRFRLLTAALPVAVGYAVVTRYTHGYFGYTGCYVAFGLRLLR